MVATLAGGRGQLSVVLICVPLVISDVERLFMGLLAVCVSCWKAHLLRSSARF